MWHTVKRLSLGLSSIALASAVLLLMDGGFRAANESRGETKVWNVSVLEYVNIPDVEEAEHGVRDGLRDAGLVEGRDYQLRVSNAQGDMATLNGLVDSAVTENADLIITLSTPTLQATLQKVRDRPVVFTFLANPFAAGAGTSDTDHRPNVTGAYGAGDVTGMVQLIRNILPRAKRMGTMFVPNEINSVFNHDLLVAAAKEAGLEAMPVGVSTPAEVPDAALALCSQRPDLLCLPAANLTASSFPSIVQATRRAGVPLFAFMGGLGVQGASVVLARDYYDMGHDGGLLAAEVIRGRDPGKLPFRPTLNSRLIINLNAARECGLIIPSDVLKSAYKVIGE